jgi:hypothetical protein
LRASRASASRALAALQPLPLPSPAVTSTEPRISAVNEAGPAARPAGRVFATGPHVRVLGGAAPNACGKAAAKLGSCVPFERCSWRRGCVRSIRGCCADES